MAPGRPTYAALRASAASIAAAFLRMALAFALAFGSTLLVQSRLADEALAADRGVVVAAKGDDAKSGGSSGGKEEEPPAPAKSSIIDIGVFLNGTTQNAYAYASRVSETRDKVCAVIEQKGGSIDFDAGVEWNDESWEYESSRVTWKIDAGDEVIAGIGPDGVLRARGTDDGTVRVTASVSGEYTASGKELSASFLVELRGQTDAKYVTGLSICDEAGNPIEQYRFEEGTLATAMIELQAKVAVHDPATGGDVTYQVTSSSGLAAQTGGELSDIQWESADTRLGTVSDEGVYRPVVEGTNIVYAYSTAGFNGQQVTASATIDTPGTEHGDYHPQNELAVKIYYEKAPDEEVGSATYSVEDLEALGTETHTYTAMRGASGFFTTTGRGPLLTKVLEDAGANPEGIARLRFGTPDNYQGVVSWDMLVDKDRYYFPNIDVNMLTPKEQVPPILAIESHRNVGTDTSPDYDMDDQRRFLLLFGSKDTGETTTNLQVYNIHTIYVELEGSPPVQPGREVWTVKYVDSVSGGVIDSRRSSDPDSEKPPEAPGHDGYKFKGWDKSVDNATRTVTYTAVYEKSGDPGDPGKPNGPESPGDPGKPNGPESPGGSEGDRRGPENNGNAGDANPGDAYDLVGADGGSAAGSDASGGSGEPGDVTQLDIDDVAPVTPGRWSALQAMNRHPSNVADLMYDNPFAPYALPTCAGVFAAGGVEAFVRFRWQKRSPK